MCRYFSRMHKEKGSGTALEPDQFFRDGLCFFLFLFFIFFIFYLFLLVFYFRISFLYITDFNLKIKILLLHYGLENGRMPWKQKY